MPPSYWASGAGPVRLQKDGGYGYTIERSGWKDAGVLYWWRSRAKCLCVLLSVDAGARRGLLASPWRPVRPIPQLVTLGSDSRSAICGDQLVNLACLAWLPRNRQHTILRPQETPTHLVLQRRLRRCLALPCKENNGSKSPLECTMKELCRRN